MMKRPIVLFLGISLIWFGCNKPKTFPKSSVNTYYDFDSLLDSQLSLVVSSNAQLRKHHQFNEYQEEILLDMDSVEWHRVLSIFHVLDINTPALKNAYKIVDSVSDSTSNLTILYYKINDRKSTQLLKELNFYYLDSIQNLKKITAISSSSGFFYNSHNSYEMIFDQSQERTLLKEYYITTTQKTLFRDSIQSNIHFEILY